jgi:serine/threonine protein kinase
VDLFERVAQDGPIPELEAKAIFKQIAESVRYLHSVEICHR